MTQKFPNITQQSYIDVGILDLQERDNTTLTLFSGEEAPENPFEGCVWNDLTNKVVKYYYSNSWIELLDYGKSYILRNNLQREYQPVNENLTEYSDVVHEGMGFISYDTWVQLSSFFVNNLSIDFLGNLNLGNLAYKSSLGRNEIADGSISQEKLSTQIITKPILNVGDCIPSFSSGNKNGCIKLSKSKDSVFTIGASASSSTYSGDKYKNLYEFLWTNYPSLQIYNNGGVVTTRGTSWTVDWDSNKRLSLPTIENPNDNKPKDVVLESSQIGSLTIEKSGYYQITIVGAGGGGAASTGISFIHRGDSNCSGASGGAVKEGIIILQEGDIINYTIGKGGSKGQPQSLLKNSIGTSGTNTTVKLNGNDLITATGGEGGEIRGRNIITGAGGSGIINQQNAFYTNPTLISGQNSASSTGSSSTSSVLGPLGNNYGKGGDASYGTTTKDGVDGYLSLIYLCTTDYENPNSNVISALDSIYSGVNYFMKF